MRPTLLLCLVGAIDLAAQTTPLNAVNAAFGDRARFSMDGDQLVIDLYDGATHVRQDVAYPEHLDTNSVAWSAEEAAIVVKCLGDQAGCVMKEVFKSGKVTPTNRSALPAPEGEIARNAALAALRAWIAAEQVRLARLASETNTRPRRKK